MSNVSVHSLYEIVQIMVKHLPQIFFFCFYFIFLLLLHIFIIPEERIVF
jgi:hypothetical protein